MQIILNDYFKHDFVEITGGKTYFVSSEDASSCELVRSLLKEQESKQKVIVFKATGLSDNLKELVKNTNLINMDFVDGDEHGFVVKRYSECYGIVSNEQLQKILDEWICTIYEKRFLFSVDVSVISTVMNLLQKSIFDEEFLGKLWPFLDLAVENALDAPSHNSFVISFKQEGLDGFCQQINDVII